MLHPSKHRVCTYPTEGPDGQVIWTWAVKAPLPSAQVLATSAEGVTYARWQEAMTQAEKFVKRHRVDFLLLERGADFSQSPGEAVP